MVKTDVATARRQLSSPNKVTRRRALRTIKARLRNGRSSGFQVNCKWHTSVKFFKTTIYHYFANKEAVVCELLVEGNTLFLQALQQRVDEAQAAGLNALDTLKTVSDAYVRFGTANPEYYNILFISNLESVSLVSLIDSGRFKGFELLEAGLKAAMEEGCIIQGDERLIASSVWSMLHGLTSLFLNFELPMAKSNDELIAFTIDTFLMGLSR